jgi:DNA-binding NarL/FixJ family response regulator
VAVRGGRHSELAAALGRWDRAVQLFAAAEALQAVHGLPGGPLSFLLRYPSPLAEACRRFPAAVGAGRAMPVEVALEAAMQTARQVADEATRPTDASRDRGEPGAAGRRDGLTRRQVEILRLAARGRSNADIADDLTLSVRTVEKHLANIYAKLGVSGRVPATVYAVRNGLLSGEPDAG